VVAALEGVVDDDDVAFLPGGEAVENGEHAGWHRAQVGRDVGRLRNHAPRAVENRAGKIEPLFDVGRVGRASQCNAHLFGDAGAAMAVKLEGDWVDAVQVWP
jgi:hypothetical protein